jgi:hypothetical protein
MPAASKQYKGDAAGLGIPLFKEVKMDFYSLPKMSNQNARSGRLTSKRFVYAHFHKNLFT